MSICPVWTLQGALGGPATWEMVLRGPPSPPRTWGLRGWVAAGSPADSAGLGCMTCGRSVCVPHAPAAPLTACFAHRPMLIDMSRVYGQTNLENLDQAFSVAERDLGVTRLLDPEGVCCRPPRPRPPRCLCGAL